MAARFVVGLALIAMCSSTPVLINGIFTRDGRSFSIGQAYSSNDGGISQAIGSASSLGGQAQAYGISTVDGAQLARNNIDGIYQTPTFGVAKAVAVAQNTDGHYYNPVAVTTDHEQNADLGQAIEIVAARNSIANQPKRIHWHFGTAYDQPRQYGYQLNEIPTYGGQFGQAKSSANTLGYGSANANAVVNNAGFGVAKSLANIHGAGSGSAQSEVNSHGSDYGLVRSYGNLYPTSIGSARANADILGGGYVAQTNANSHGHGSAISSAQVDGGYGAFRYALPYQASNGRAAVNSQTFGSGNASSFARTNGLASAVNSAANSSGYGSARANAQSA